MAIKAIDSVSVIDYTDVSNVKTWYLAVSRTSSAPTVAEHATEAQVRADGWDTTEPPVDITKKLYKVNQCLFGDGTYIWSEVSLSSSYEAAIQAYNDAEAAKRVATNFIMEHTDNASYFHAENSAFNPATGNAVKITDQIDIIRNGESAMAIGETNDAGDAIVRIGNPGETRAEIDYHSLKLIEKEGKPYFYVSDLRNKQGVATITREYRDNFPYTRGIGYEYSLDFQAINTDYDVIVNDQSPLPSGWSVEKATTRFSIFLDMDAEILPTDPDNHITATYTTDEKDLKAYTVGIRKSESYVGPLSYAEGYITTSSGYASHAEGHSTTASGAASHAEGQSTTAKGDFSHAEGHSTTASGAASHAEGSNSKTKGDFSHAEGVSTTASSIASHAEGQSTTAGGIASHAEGYTTIASGYASHAGGYYTVAQRKSQTALGEYNVADTTGSNTTRGDYAVVIGNGTSNNARSNALTVAWNGDVDIASGAKYKINGTDLIDIFYPVGSYYETSDAAFNPNTAWGGTWVEDTAGRVTVAQDADDTNFGSIGNTGGNKNIQAHTHGHTNPSVSVGGHSHTPYHNTYQFLSVETSGASVAKSKVAKGSTTDKTYIYSDSTVHRNDTTASAKSTVTLNGGSVNGVTGLPTGQTTGSSGNLQPYIVVRRWHRTA